tara:strand:- start:445 stop:741 length:297 start_codon:yes stop_codon:yes gene_type:complete
MDKGRHLGYSSLIGAKGSSSEKRKNKMKTLDMNLIQHANYCGLPSKFALRLRVLQYAQLTISAEEYAEFYGALTPSEKFVADLLVREIENELLQEVGA